MPEIARMSHTHLDIARFLLENPMAPLSAVAEHFGYTQSWLSTMIHSSAFQAHLAELQGKADNVVILDVPARLRGVADTALEKLGEQLDQVITEGPGFRVDRDFVLDTAEKTLKALGYGARSAPEAAPGGSGNTVIYADAVMINSARERILERGRIIDSSSPEPRQLTSDEQIPSSA